MFFAEPRQILKRIIVRELNLNITEFSQRIGYSRNRITGITIGKFPITIKFALALEAHTNYRAEAWLNLQVQYELLRSRSKLQNNRCILK